SAADKVDAWLVPFVFVTTFIAYYFSVLPLLNDNDVAWHIAAGRLLLHTHHLPTNDPWSYVSKDTPWYLLSWIWDIVLGIVEWVSGTFGIFIFMLLLTAAIIAGLAALLLRLPIARPAVFLTILVAALCMLEFCTARPQIAGYIFALVAYGILQASRHSG